MFDDTANIVENSRLALTELKLDSLLEAALSSDSGALKRPLAMMTFAINHYFAGGLSDTWQFKVTNLAIHLINAGLVYWLVSLLLAALQKSRDVSSERRHRWVPALVTAIWALHPIQLTSVLYVVQRMTSLSALFVLAGLIAYVCGRLRLENGRPRAYSLMAAGLITGMGLGIACKENAALWPFFALVIEFVFFERRRLEPPHRRKLAWFHASSLLVLVAIAAAWLAMQPDVVSSTYSAREFTPGQRLLTEARVLWIYIGLLFIPDIRNYSLFHDDIAISTSLIAPWTTLPALLGLAALLTLAVTRQARTRYPMFSFAVLWFLAGHSMESGVIGLELAHEHRNYLPSLGPLLGGVVAVAAVPDHRLRPRVTITGMLLLAAALGVVTHLRSHQWHSETDLIQAMTLHHPGSARSHGMLAEIHAKRHGDAVKSLSHYQTAAALAPWETSYLIRMAMVAAQAPVNRASSPIDEALGAAQTERIARQLAQQSLTPSAATDLRTMAVCLTGTSCARLYPQAARWYQAVIGNPHVKDDLRHTVIIYLFNVSVTHKDYATALVAANLGRRYYPADTDFALMQANACILSGRLNEARDILASVGNPAGDRRQDLPEKIAALRAMLKKAAETGPVNDGNK